ncbi:MAG: hypothetical protein JWM95_4427 [Gemmatimonadetes bacterium]|nr:hypothetical protein [Gemmatimonadota bacterium]
MVVGAIGTESRSWSDTGELKKFDDAVFAGVCDVDLARARTNAAPNRLNLDEKNIYPNKGQFTNSALANSMLDRPRRKGFELPKA